MTENENQDTEEKKPGLSLAVALSKFQSFLLNHTFHLIIVFILGFGIGLHYNKSVRTVFDLPDWAIVSDNLIDSDPDAANAMFNKHVENEFYPGMEEKYIIKDLRKYGFRLDWRARQDAKVAFHNEWRGKCKYVRTVTWQTNNNHLITSSTGSLWKICK